MHNSIVLTSSATLTSNLCTKNNWAVWFSFISSSSRSWLSGLKESILSKQNRSYHPNYFLVSLRVWIGYSLLRKEIISSLERFSKIRLIASTGLSIAHRIQKLKYSSSFFFIKVSNTYTKSFQTDTTEHFMTFYWIKTCSVVLFSNYSSIWWWFPSNRTPISVELLRSLSAFCNAPS